MVTDLAKREDCFSFQLIDGNGNFNHSGLEDFVTKVNFSTCGPSYAVVAIIGPQSSGKSTLLNHLFHTNFKQMDSFEGRSKTTQGLWLARCPDIEPLMLVMDIEGTDGRERGEDDTAFEKQSALFALAVADVVLVNMRCQDIGLVHAANMPLLKAVFQQVVIRFSSKPHKITLVFVVRDKTKKSPEEKLKASLEKDIDKVWASIQKPPESSNMQLSNFFKVEVVFLPNYEEREEDFKVKVQDLKQRFVHSTAPRGLAEARDQKEPASGFSIIAQKIWKDIMENKDLNLPAYKVLVATIRCEEIRNEKYDSFEMNEDWSKLCKEAQFGFVRDFGKKINSILNTYISEYDKEALYFDEAVTNEKRKELLDKMLQLIKPVYKAMLSHLRLEHLNKFMETFDKDSDEHSTLTIAADDCIKDCLLEFDKDCEAVRIERANWDTLKARAKLQRNINSYIRENKLASKIKLFYEPKLKQVLSDTVGFLLCEEADPSWSKIRRHYKSVRQLTVSRLNGTLSELGIDQEVGKEKVERIKEYAKEVVEAKAREESGRAKSHMIRKFVKHFKYDDNSSPRDWNNKEEILMSASAALSTPLKLLAGLVAIRLEDSDADNIEDILSNTSWNSPSFTLNQWAQVPPSRTLITPIQCKELWEEYLDGANDAIKQANEDLEEKLKKSPSWQELGLQTLQVVGTVASVVLALRSGGLGVTSWLMRK